MIDQSELNPNQFPAWAEFTRETEDMTKVSPREGFQLETLIDQNGTPTMARVGAGIIESGEDASGSWYRIYGDGWAECGGITASYTPSSTTAYGALYHFSQSNPVVFPVEFSAVTARANLRANNGIGGVSHVAYGVSGISSIRMFNGTSTAPSVSISWRAEGWLA